jgi:hypothetical protein
MDGGGRALTPFCPFVAFTPMNTHTAFRLQHRDTRGPRDPRERLGMGIAADTGQEDGAA